MLGEEVVDLFFVVGVDDIDEDEVEDEGAETEAHEAGAAAET